MVNTSEENASSLLWYREWELQLCQNGTNFIFMTNRNYYIIIPNELYATVILLQATTTTYNSSDLCDSPGTDWGWMDPGLLHTVVMDK